MEKTQPIRIFAIHSNNHVKLGSPTYLVVLTLNSMFSFGQTQIPGGNIMLLSPFWNEQLELLPGCRGICCEISVAYLENAIGIPFCNPLITDHEIAESITEKLITLYDQNGERDELHHLRQNILELELLELLYKHAAESTQLNKAEPSDTEGGMQGYIQQNFRQPLTLQNIAEHFHFSKQYLSTVFHKKYGITVSAYLQTLRLKEAKRLLYDTTLTVTDVAGRSGFPNIRAMNQAFMDAHQCTAAEYRRMHPRASVMAEQRNDSKVLSDISRLLHQFRVKPKTENTNVRLKCYVDGTGAVPATAPWLDILNIDVCSDLLHAHVQEMLRTVQAQIPFRYARLSNILDIQLINYIPASDEYRYTAFVRVIDFLKSIGLTPMLCWGNNYEIMSDSLWESQSPYMKTENDIHDLLDGLLNVAIDRWGQEWVSTWRFEFRMPTDLYGSDDPADFMGLFQRIREKIKGKLSNAAIGGPALPYDSAHLKRWKAFFQGLDNMNAPDFISVELWHDYTLRKIPVSHDGPRPNLFTQIYLDKVEPTDSSRLQDKVTAIREMMENTGIGDKKLIISALGVTKYQATAAQLGGHCCANLVKSNLLLSEWADGIGCWKLSNSEAEYPDEYQVYNSGCGIMGRYGLKHPGWYAYYFLAQQLPILYLKNRNLLVTTDGNNRYVILLHNCKEYSMIFYKSYGDIRSQDFENARLYQDTVALQQTIVLNDVPNGSYLVKQYLVGDHYGSVASVMNQMGIVHRFDYDEISYIEGRSLPYQHTFSVPAEDGLSLSVSLRANEVMLLLISPETKDKNEKA